MKKRVFSALIAIIILVPFLIVGGIPFAIAMGILSVFAYKEIIDLKKSHQEYPKLIVILGLISMVYLILGNYGINSLEYAVSYPRLLVPLLFMLLPLTFYKNEDYSSKDAFYLIGAIYLLGMLFNLIIIIRNINIYLLLYLLCVTILTDTFAFLIGSLIGKHKMAPKISPNKSWEGFLGGLIGGSIIALILYCNLLGKFNIKILLVTLILSIIGQFGDLVYSKIKRENNIKDFSNIMPGHGGVLDRLDSLTFVIFAYVVILWFI